MARITKRQQTDANHGAIATAELYDAIAAATDATAETDDAIATATATITELHTATAAALTATAAANAATANYRSMSAIFKGLWTYEMYEFCVCFVFVSSTCVYACLC